MKAAFWHERWEANQLGFHQAEVNTLLKTWWPHFEIEADAPVFVPLCGKSLDMTWLRGEGHPVIGVEVSPIAVRDFFSEAEITPERHTAGSLECLSGGGYTLYCGDFFSIEAETLSQVRAVYDRASLIALPPDMRKRYAEQMISILPDAAEIMLVTIEYDQTKMSGASTFGAPRRGRIAFRRRLLNRSPVVERGPRTDAPIPRTWP